MKKKIFINILVLFVLLTGFTANVWAEPTVVDVKSFSFEGVTNSEKVTVTFNDDAYIMVYETPNKTYRYLVSNVKCTTDQGYESVSFTATEPALGNETFILINRSDNFTDCRIGSKIIKFKVVRKYSLELDLGQ